MKKRFLSLVCVLVIWPAISFGQDEPLANKDKAGLYVRSLEQVLRLEPEEVDLATAAFIVSEQWSDLVYGRRCLEKLDEMALEIREKLEAEGSRTDYRAVAAINEYLFEEQKFKSVKEANKAEDLFLHSVLDNKQGYCLSLSILYLSIGERLGLPLYGVVVPGHFFVRYDDGRGVRFNIETTSKGGYAPDEHYIKKFNVPEDNDDSIYMKNLNKLQTLGCLFNNLGNVYSQIGNTDSAQMALERAVEINPSLAESRTNLGNIYLQKGRVDDAIYEYEQALRINSDDASTHNNLGNAYFEKKRLHNALSQYNTAMALDPNLTDIYKSLANVYCELEMFELAQSKLRQAMALEPKDPDLYCHLGYVYSRMGAYEQALSQYAKSLSLKPDFATAHYNMGVCYNKLGLVDDEIQAYKKALSIEPNMVDALANLADAYFALKDYDAAIEQYKRALKIKPDDAGIHYNLGAAYDNKSEYDNAVAEYLRAVELKPEMAAAHSCLAYSFYQLKKYDLAWKHAQIAEQSGAKIPEDLLAAIESKVR